MTAMLIVVALASSPLQAQRQSLASIALQAEDFLTGFEYSSPYPPEITLRPLDSRLNLTPCAQPLAIGFHNRCGFFGLRGSDCLG